MPACNAATSAGSSTMEPRAMLTSAPSGPSASSTVRFTIPCVAPDAAAHTTSTSDPAANACRSATKL